MALRREIIYDQTFEEQKKLLGQDVERLDSVIRSGVESRMSSRQMRQRSRDYSQSRFY